MKPRHHCAVALNARFSGTLQPTGTQVASFHLFDAIVRSERRVPLVVYADRRFPGIGAWASVPDTQVIDVPFSSWPRSLSQMWEQLVLPASVRRHGCALVHHPMTTCSRWHGGVRHLVTVHDLNFFHHPEWIGRAFRWWMSGVVVPAIKHADHVVAVSDYVLNDLRQTFGIAEHRSCRIYNGLPPLRAQGMDRGAAASRTVLGVNLWQPHKNLPRLLAAFSRIRLLHPEVELHLAGRPQANFRAQNGLAPLLELPGVRVLGYLPEHELAGAYATATVVCYPSLGEGFGLPVLEAMAAGTRVVTSNVSCLPEIARGAAILVDPSDEASIAAGILESLNESADVRAAQVARGRTVAASYRWEDAAMHYIGLYGKLQARSMAGKVVHA